MAKTFSASVAEHVARTKVLMEAVFRESVQRLASDAQTTVGEGGNLRVKTGFLRASFIATINARVNQVQFNPTPNADGIQHRYSDGQIALVLNGASLGDTIYLTWTANYAVHREYQDGFARLAAQRWQAIVDGVVSDLAGRGL